MEPRDFLSGSDSKESAYSKESACSAGDPVSILGSARSPEERNGNQL